MQSGRYDDLRSMLDKSISYSPNEPSFHFHYASALGKAGQYEESERHFLLALEKSGNDHTSIASYHANLGISLLLVICCNCHTCL